MNRLALRSPIGPDARRAGAGGFTLVEILVALGLGMLILLALTILFSRNTGNQSELERTVRQVESVRFAVDALAEDVMHAGYFSEFNPNTLIDAPAYQTPGPCEIGIAAQGWNTEVASPVPVQMPVAVQGIAAGPFVGDACLLNRLAGTEAIVVRRADTGPAISLAAAAAAPNNLYIQIARCVTDTQRVRAAAGNAGTFSLRQPDCATVNGALRRLIQRTYYIAACNDCAGGGDGIPTLKRAEMINGAMQLVSLAEGIENMQLEYGLDTSAAPGDGIPDTFVATVGITGAMPNLWQNVVAVRLHLLARSTQTTPGYSDVRTYQVGAVPVTPNDGFKRTLMTTTARLYNVGGRRE